MTLNLVLSPIKINPCQSQLRRVVIFSWQLGKDKKADDNKLNFILIDPRGNVMCTIRKLVWYVLNGCVQKSRIELSSLLVIFNVKKIT